MTALLLIIITLFMIWAGMLVGMMSLWNLVSPGLTRWHYQDQWDELPAASKNELMRASQVGWAFFCLPEESE